MNKPNQTTKPKNNNHIELWLPKGKGGVGEMGEGNQLHVDGRIFGGEHTIVYTEVLESDKYSSQKRKRNKRYLNWKGGLPWWSSGWEAMLPGQGAQVRSLVRELDPTCMPQVGNPHATTEKSTCHN